MRPSSTLARLAVVASLAVLTAAPVAAQQKKPAAKATKEGKEGKDSARDAALQKALLKETARVERSYLKDLGSIVTWAASKGLAKEAEELLAKMAKIDPDFPDLTKLKRGVEKAKAGAAAKDEAKAKADLSARLQGASDRHASRLFDLAKRCMQFGLFTNAYEMVKDVLDADPDHKQARQILGYVWDAATKSWITKWEAETKKTSFLTPEGWVKKADKPKWDKGLRNYKGKWVSIEEEKRIRTRNDLEPFSAETEHFIVKSNLGRQKAYEFALRLEDYYRVFFEFFIGFHDQTASAKLFFNMGGAKKKHEVLVFPSRVEYLDFVRREKGNDELLVRSAGFWSAGEQRSFFFWTDSDAEALNTLYHETTHQLLGETKPGSGGSAGNVWLVEGIATYTELWEKVNGRWRPGYRIDSPILRSIQDFLAKNASWDLSGYLALDHKEFHDKAGRTLHYFMGGALCHFFLHYEDGIYREDFIRLLRDYYDGKLRADAVTQYIQVEGLDPAKGKLATLDAQFRAYMKDLKRPGSGEDAGPDGAAKEETTKGGQGT